MVIDDTMDNDDGICSLFYTEKSEMFDIKSTMKDETLNLSIS